MEFVISQDISESGVCQSFFIFLICILLPSDPLSLLAIALMVLAGKGDSSAVLPGKMLKYSEPFLCMHLPLSYAHFHATFSGVL